MVGPLPLPARHWLVDSHQPLEHEYVYPCDANRHVEQLVYTVAGSMHSHAPSINQPPCLALGVHSVGSWGPSGGTTAATNVGCTYHHSSHSTVVVAHVRFTTHAHTHIHTHAHTHTHTHARTHHRHRVYQCRQDNKHIRVLDYGR